MKQAIKQAVKALFQGLGGVEPPPKVVKPWNDPKRPLQDRLDWLAAGPKSLEKGK